MEKTDAPGLSPRKEAPPLVSPLEEFREGVDLVRNTRFADAEEYYTKLALLVPENKNNMWYLLNFAEAAFWKAALSSDDEALMNLGFERAKPAEQIATQIYEMSRSVAETSSLLSFFKKPIQTDLSKPQLERRFKESSIILGEIYLGYAVAYFRTQQYVKGGYYLRKSWKYYEPLLEMKVEKDPALSGRINFGVGFFQLLISLIPGSFLWLIEMVGFKANRDIAFAHLQLCRESKCIRAPEAAMILVLVKWFFLEQKEDAEKLLYEVLEQHPTSAMYRMVAGFIENRSGNLSKAVDHFEEASAYAREVPQFQLTAKYEQAHCHFLKCDWNKATPAIEQYLNESTSPNFKAYGTFKLGFCYWMLGKPEKIPGLYVRVHSLVRPSYSFDRYAERMATKFLENSKFTPYDELSIQAGNLVEAKMFNPALGKVEQIALLLGNDFKGPERLEDCWGMYHYLKGRIMKGFQQYPEAIENFEKVIKAESSIAFERYVIPHTYIELGEMFAEQEEWATAGECFLKAKAFPTPYDFDRPAQLRITKGIERVKKHSSAW